MASDEVWKVHPIPRKVGVSKLNLDCEALHSGERREGFQAKVDNVLHSDSEGALCDLGLVWKHFEGNVCEVA